MDWTNILQNKKQCGSWKDEIIDKSVIDSIINDIHTHCNSKQNRVPIQITAMDWSRPKKRDFIFHYAVDHPRKHYNTQVLAPWILTFSIRDVPSLALKDLYRVGGIEVGLAAQMAVLSAVDKGLDIGFCKCFMGERSKEYEKVIGIQAPDLIIGLGHYENKPIQHNPGDGKDYEVWISTSEKNTSHVKPPLEDYFKYYV